MDIGTAVSSPLAPRLQGLPLVIAGPILRRVTDSSVTVWVALQKSASVTLQILSGVSGTGGTVGSATTQPTVAVGRFLHIVAVTAQASLSPGVIYRYNLTADVWDLAGHKIGKDVPLLATVTVPNPISYPPYDLPSFSLPPKELNDLRIIHGSCRMPHGNGPDALSLLDELIRVTVQNAAKRPHQLLLNGDQIYADDVSAALLLQIMDASNTLLGTDQTADKSGWQSEETLPGAFEFSATYAGEYGSDGMPSDFPPLTRTALLGREAVGFTSADLRNHLMALGEYLCFYLFTWSDVLWPPSGSLPTADAIKELAWHSPGNPHEGLSKKDINSIPGDTKDVLVHLKTLPRVRRALANIPTYMIFDDHDVTDDWNMSLDFVNQVYANKLGRRIVQNALVAYALCQLWGNVPEQFQNDASGEPAAGRQLLNLLDRKTSGDYDKNSDALQKLVGVHTSDQISARTPEAVFHDQSKWLTIGGVQVSADSLVYNFTYTGPSHQIVFTDTRSWRSYRLGKNATPDLLPPDQIAAQIPLTPALGGRVLMIVLTTNAPPVQPIRGATRHDTITTTLSAHVPPTDAYPDLFEAWEIPSLAFDRLLTRICEKFKPNQTGYAVLMSGDVHFSFATRLIYDATNPYGATTPQTMRAVVAQLVSSANKKQDPKTIGFQRDGYFYVPSPACILGQFESKDMSEGYVGWNAANAPSFGGGTVEQWNASHANLGYHSHPIREITNTDPTLQIYPRPSNDDFAARILLDRKPDYRYRLDYLLPESQFTQPNPSANHPIGPMPASGATPEERAQAMKAFNNATGHYREHNRNPYQNPLIGRNNLCEVTFDWGAKDSSGDHKTVNHTVRWRKNGTFPDDPAPDPDLPNTTVWWTNYAVSLDPNDANYPDYKADKEGS